MVTGFKAIVRGAAQTNARRWPDLRAWLRSQWHSAFDPVLPLAAEDHDLSHRILKY